MRNANNTDLNPQQFDHTQNDALTTTHCTSELFCMFAVIIDCRIGNVTPFAAISKRGFSRSLAADIVIWYWLHLDF